MSLFTRLADKIDDDWKHGLFTRRVPSFSEFVTSSEYLNQPPLFRAQHSAFAIPFGDNPELYFSRQKRFAKIALCYGKGSGKAFYAAYSISYLVYTLACFSNVYKFLEIPNDSPLDILIVASSQKQSSGIVYERLCRCLESPCFRPFSVKIGKEQTTVKPSITIHAMSSNPASLEGFSPILSLMDEASGFRDASGASSAEEVYKVLTTSAHSRFLNSSTVFITSYPRRHNDFILRLVNKAEKDKSIWADKKASWEVRDDRTEEDYAGQFAADFDTASAFYGCKPPLGFGLWFKNRELLDGCFGGINPEVTYREYAIDGYTKIDIMEMSPAQDARYFAHGDPGVSNDAFALAIGRAGTDGKVSIVGILRWKPDKKLGVIVDLSNVLETVKKLNEKFHFSQVTFDSFQSASFVQSLIDSGIPSSDMSFSSTQQLEMYRNLRALVDSRAIEIIESSIALKEMRELETNDSGRPDHPYGGSKDVADCIAAVSLAISQLPQASGFSVEDNFLI